MAQAHEDYVDRAKLLDPITRADELATAGVPPDEVAAALWCECHDLPDGYELTTLDRHELHALAGRAYQRHALHLHGLCEPSAAAFQATNKLGYSRGSVDREMAASIKDLQGASHAELQARLAELARRLQAKAPARDGETLGTALVQQLGDGTRDAYGTQDGTCIDVDLES